MQSGKNVRNLVVLAAIVGLLGCPKKDDEDAPVALVPTPVVATTSAAPAEIKPEPLKLEARVKGEVDARADGLTGSPMPVTGSVAALQSPTGWQVTKGAVTIATSPDGKARLAAAPFTAAEGPLGQLASASAALGLSACQWGAPEALTVGAGKLAATGADGLCTRGTAQVRAAYVAPTAERLLVVADWAPDGDSASCFGAMRSIAKPVVAGGDSTGIAACCSALRQNAKSAPPQQQGIMLMAAGACDALRSNPQGRAALGQVRAMLAGANVPSSCQ
jgi:hypothetical protein